MEFNKIIDNFMNIDVIIKYYDKYFLLLCVLPRSFENFKDSMLYGKEDTVSQEEVKVALKIKELTKFKYMKVDDGEQGLNVLRGRSENMGNNKGNKSRSKSKSKGVDKG